MPDPDDTGFFGWRRQRAPEGTGPISRAQRGGHRAKPESQVTQRHGLQAAKDSDDVTLEFDVACDVRTDEAQLTRSPDDTAQGVRRADVDGSKTIGRTDAATVPEFEPNRKPSVPENAAKERGERSGSTRRWRSW
jgi:hypothetical protein